MFNYFWASKQFCTHYTYYLFKCLLNKAVSLSLLIQDTFSLFDLQINLKRTQKHVYRHRNLFTPIIFFRLNLLNLYFVAYYEKIFQFNQANFKHKKIIYKNKIKNTFLNNQYFNDPISVVIVETKQKMAHCSTMFVSTISFKYLEKSFSVQSGQQFPNNL